ncbi:hypothetical protein SRHO_G00153360 [Serrasalmus rhombeus]
MLVSVTVGQRLALLALALLGIVGLLPRGCLSRPAEDEDYYMQELLSREHYYRIPVQEENPAEGDQVWRDDLQPPAPRNKSKTKPTSGKQAGAEAKSGEHQQSTSQVTYNRMWIR